MEEDTIILALREQVECYRKLAKLAGAQHEYVQRGQTEQLLEVLGRRQAVLEQIARLEGQIGPAKRQWGMYVAGLDETSRGTAELLVKETRVLLEQITTADRNDALVLQQQKLNLGRQIKEASAARQVNQRYAAAAYGAKAGRMDVQR
jgi:hypothetical protein